MAHIKFTDAVIRNIQPPEKGRIIYWAEGMSGFGLRCGAGKKSFITKVGIHGHDYMATHGRYPELTLRAALILHSDMVEAAERGIAPSSPLKGGKTVAEFGDAYFKHRAQRGYSDVKNQQSMFQKDVVPVLGRKLPIDIGVKDIRRCIEKTLARIQKENPDRDGAGLSHIRHLQVLLRGVFKWLQSTGEIDINPTIGMETVGIARVRERVLTPVEIWRFWNAIDLTGIDNPVVGAMKFLLVTGQRSKEVRSLKWSDIEDDKFWIISGGTAKNKRMHRVPLNDIAVRLIKESRPLNYTRDESDIFVFGGAAMLSERTLSKALARNREKINVDNVTPHDLRRTVATMITAVGLPALYASLLLNHTQQGVTNRVYVQYSYDFEKRRAAGVWDFILKSILSARAEKDVPTLDKLRDMVRKKGMV